MRIALHGVREFLAGLILFRWSEAHAVLRGYGEIMSSAPDELSVLAGELGGPDGSPVAFLAPVWTGAPAEGERQIARLRSLGAPVLTQLLR
jgi:hypothetical protein